MNTSAEIERPIELSLHLVMPDGQTADRVTVYRNATRTCRGCDPPPNAPPHVCANTCEVRSYPQPIYDFERVPLLVVGRYELTISSDSGLLDTTTFRFDVRR